MSETLLVALTRDDIEALDKGERYRPLAGKLHCMGCGAVKSGGHFAGCPEVARVEAARAKLRGDNHLTVAAVLTLANGRPVADLEWSEVSVSNVCVDCGSPMHFDVDGRHAAGCPTLLAQAEHDATVAKLRRLAGAGRESQPTAPPALSLEDVETLMAGRPAALQHFYDYAGDDWVLECPDCAPAGKYHLEGCPLLLAQQKYDAAYARYEAALAAKRRLAGEVG